jgi:hypothetical protein
VKEKEKEKEGLYFNIWCDFTLYLYLIWCDLVLIL